MQSAPRARRQPAWHMLASEFGDSSLSEQGSGEFDPLFVITKLGAKVNRLVVAGLIERLEPRETSSGSTLWQGQLRDPSGLHYFSVGDYASETMRELVVQWARKVEEGETLMLMMVAKAKFFQTEEGAIYTSLRPEEAAEISPSVYRDWLVASADGLLNRIDWQQKSTSLDKTPEAMREGGIPEHLIQGLLLANIHYGEIDLETFRLNIMQVLDIAEGRTPSPKPPTESNQQTSIISDVESSTNTVDLKEVLMGLIDRLDQGEGVDFDALLSNAAARGHDREAAEAALDELSDQGSVHEPRFGWFKRTV